MNFIKSLFKKTEKKQNVYAAKEFQKWANTDEGKKFMEYLVNEYYLFRPKLGTVSENALIHQGQLQVIDFLIRCAYYVEIQ